MGRLEPYRGALLTGVVIAIVVLVLEMVGGLGSVPARLLGFSISYPRFSCS